MAGLRGPTVDLELGNTPERPSPATVRGSGYTSVQADDSDRYAIPHLNTRSDAPPPSYQSHRPSSSDRDANAPQVYNPPQTSPFIPPATKHYAAQPPIYRDPFLNPNTIKDNDIESRLQASQRGPAGYASRERQAKKNNDCRNILIGLTVVHFIVAIVVIVIKVNYINNNR